MLYQQFGRKKFPFRRKPKQAPKYYFATGGEGLDRYQIEHILRDGNYAFWGRLLGFPIVAFGIICMPFVIHDWIKDLQSKESVFMHMVVICLYFLFGFAISSGIAFIYQEIIGIYQENRIRRASVKDLVIVDIQTDARWKLMQETMGPANFESVLGALIKVQRDPGHRLNLLVKSVLTNEYNQQATIAIARALAETVQQDKERQARSA